MPKASHFVPNKQLVLVFLKANTLNKVHFFQRESTGERAKDSAGSSLESHPGQPLIVFREGGGRETRALKTPETYKRGLETACFLYPRLGFVNVCVFC